MVWVVRAFVSVLLVGVLVARVGMRDVVDSVGGANPTLLLAGLISLSLAFVISSERWRLFLLTVGLDRSARSTLRVTYVSAFVTNFLPGAIGGDAARTWLVGPGRRRAGLSTVLADRSTLFACGVSLAWVAVPLAHAPLSLVLALVAATAAVALAIAILICRPPARLERRLRRVDVASLGEALRMTARSSSAGPRALVLGLAYQLLVVAEVWFLAKGINLDLSYWQLAVMTPPVLLLSALPVSIGAFGVRELGFVATLGTLGVTASEATALGLLTGATFLVASLPGAVGIVSRRTMSDAARSAPRAPAEAGS